MEMLGAAFGAFLIQIPVVLVWIAGLVLALVRWRRHPKVSLLALIGIAGFLVMALIGACVTTWLPVTLINSQGLSSMELGGVMVAIGIVTSLITAVFWVLLLGAIFGGRDKAAVVAEGDTYREYQEP